MAPDSTTSTPPTEPPGKRPASAMAPDHLDRDPPVPRRPAQSPETTLTCRCARAGEVTLVSLVVGSDVRASVTVESTLTPVRPPRRRGVPDACWTGGRATIVVPAGGRRGVGYATPADPTDDPPARVVAAEAVSGPGDGEGIDDGRLDPTTEGVVRALGDGRPPREVVPAVTAAERRAAATLAEAGPLSDAARTLTALGGLARARAVDRRVDPDLPVRALARIASAGNERGRRAVME